MSRFKKIKYDGEVLTLVTLDSGVKWEKEETTTSREAPHPDFIAALGALVGPVLELCELPEDYGQGLTVRGVSFSADEDGNRGAVVTTLKQLDTVPAPLVLNTPHVSERPDADGVCGMPDDLSDALDALEREAAAFARGKRAQADLFGAGDDALDNLTTTISVGGHEIGSITGRQLAAAARGL